MPEFYHYIEEDEESVNQGDGVSEERRAQELSSENEQSVAENENRIHLRFAKRYETFMEGLRQRKNGQEITPEDIAVINKRLKGLDNLDNYIENHYDKESDQTLHEKQMNVFEKLREFLEKGETDGYIKLPTGAGKTVIFTEFLEAFNQRTLIVVPTKLLISQTQEKINQFAPDVEVGEIYQYAKQFDKQVTVATYQSLIRQVEEGNINPEDFDCLILDEAHESLSKKRLEAVQKFTKAIKIGFTATPQYSDEKSAKKLIGSEIYNMGLKEAVAEGMICPFSVMIAKTEADLTNVKITETGEYNEKELARAIDIESRNKAAVKLYQEVFFGKKAVLYAINVEHARKMAEMFNRAEISAAMVFAGTSEQDRKNILANYASGEIMVLCNVGVLTQGFDEPSASVCLNLRPTLSPVMAEQRGGRVLRRDPNNSEKFATVVEFLDENKNKRYSPVTFADIAGGAIIDRPFIDGDGVNKPKGNQEIKNLSSKTKELHIEGLEVIVDTNEVMRVIGERQQQKYEYAPEGWITRANLRYSSNAGRERINEIVEKYKQQKPEWFGIYLSSDGNPHEYFHPNMAEIIEKEYSQYELAPKGWETVFSLARREGVPDGQVQRISNKYKTKNPEYFKKYLTSNNQLRDYMSPELVEIIVNIIKEKEQYDSVPNGWLSKFDIRQDLKVGSENEIVGEIIKKYKQQKPEWFKVYLPATGKEREYLHPELVRIIKEEYLEKRGNLAPEGWKVAKRASTDLGISERVFNKLVAEHLEANFQMAGMFVNNRGQICKFFHPDLLGKIAGMLEKIEYPPQGWKTAGEWAGEIGISRKNFMKKVVKIEEDDPALSGSYRGKNSLISKFYSPDLIEILKKDSENK